MRRFKTQSILTRAALTLLVMLLTATTTWAQFSGGSGTQADPYQIATVDDLNQLANNVNGGTKYSNTYFVMTADITYSYEGLGSTESNYTAIGISESRYFDGHFDGQNHTLRGIRLYKGGNNQSDRVQGVCGWITSEVKNLILADANITAHSFTGGIAGSNSYGYISGCHVLSDVTICTPQSYAFNVGGIAGFNKGTVTGCTSAASIVNIYSSNEDNGGVVGYNNETGTVSDCLFLGNTLGNPEKKVYGLGAIVGLNRGTVRNSFYTSTTIQGRDGNGNLLANEESAVGQNDGTVSNCGSDWSNEFFVNGDEYTIQTATGWNIFYCLMYHNDLYNRFSGKTVKLGADISITHSAGSAGHEFMGTFDGNYHTLTVNITETTAQGTAPFREIRGATIRKLITTGSVTGTTHAAGLVGFARGDASVTNTIERCKVATNVTVTTANGNGNYHCGGVVGHALNSTLNISNTVYCGAISNSGNYVGGFQGWCDGNTVNLNNCLFTGSYSGGGVFHPMAVRNKNVATTATVNNAFYSVTPTLTNAEYIAANGTKTVGVTITPTTLGSEVERLNFMTVYQGGILFDGLYYAAPILSTDSDGAFVINNASDWEYFCEDLQDNDTWNRFSGKTVKLGADISVTRMAGSSNHDFCGTFDGGHHKLTFTSTEDVNGVAPFSYISTTLANPDDAESSPASIKNLNVVCDITTAATHASGLVGRAWGVLNIEGCTVSGTITTSDKYACGFIGEVNCSPANITNCRSSITVISNVEGDGTHGGFVGRTTGNSSLNIEGSIFDGKLLTTGGTTNCGGFVGWRATNAPLIKNCLYAPAAPAEGETWVSDENSATLCRNDATITNSYFTDTLGVVQGKQAHSIIAGEGVTVGFSGTAAEYETSGITAYDTGIMYNGVPYAGNEEQVSLNLDGSSTGYTASAGTLTGEGNPFTLTMPDEDVTITTAPQFQMGDVNHDNSIDIDDVTKLISMVLGLTPSNSEADCDGNNGVDIDDVTKLINFVLSGHWN